MALYLALITEKVKQNPLVGVRRGGGGAGKPWMRGGGW